MKALIITALAAISWSQAVTGLQIPPLGSNQCTLWTIKLPNVSGLDVLLADCSSFPPNSPQAKLQPLLRLPGSAALRRLSPHPQLLRGLSMFGLRGLPVCLLMLGGFSTHDDGGADAHGNVPNYLDGHCHLDIDCHIAAHQKGACATLTAMTCAALKPVAGNDLGSKIIAVSCLRCCGGGTRGNGVAFQWTKSYHEIPSENAN
ncbi:hypothetical protein PspLS_09293 [Pyricularia sp. CBS 133598]|nr:hypothetical protein PspLS_09293 [Pyricularia sp. CBS 133598]